MGDWTDDVVFCVTLITGDVRRAYRSLALRHHPDKSVNALSFVNSSLAFQSVLNSAGGDGLIAHTSEALRSDADRIFKLLGEANACLSDPVRSFYSLF